GKRVICSRDANGDVDRAERPMRTARTLAILALYLTSGGCDESGPAAPRQPAAALPDGALLEVPVIDRPVVDTIGLLSTGERSHLDRKLRALREKTGAHMAVVLVSTTGDEPIEDFSMRVAS